MNLEFNFVVDAVVRTKIYPALAQHQAEPYTHKAGESLATIGPTLHRCAYRSIVNRMASGSIPLLLNNFQPIRFILSVWDFLTLE